MAAGIEWFGIFGDSDCECLFFDIGEDEVVMWNPLTDDGDAFRLAVELRLTVCTDGDATVSACEAWRKDGIFVTQSVSECSGRFDATRRAIVRAAAAMAEGKA